VTDDTACLQSAVDKAAKGLLFLPFGNYRVSSTIQLHSHTKIMGEGLSRIILADNATGYDTPTQTKPIVATPDDAAGSVVLADVRITSGAGNVGAVLLDWAVGEASGLFDVHLTVGSANEGAGGLGIQDAGEVSTLFQIRGHGGGVFANVGNAHGGRGTEPLRAARCSERGRERQLGWTLPAGRLRDGGRAAMN
jgi:hypothetical protein